jgi:hypothetical protein
MDQKRWRLEEEVVDWYSQAKAKVMMKATMVS